MSVARRGRPAVLLFALAASASIAACDTAPGLVAEAARPTIENVRVTPVRDSLATDAPTAAVPLAIEADLGGEGPITVRVLVRYAETDSVAARATAEAGPGRVRVEVPLVLPRGATGDYEVDVTTEGPDGRLGDRAAAVFRFAAASLGPPVVTVEAPDAVTADADGAAEFTVTVVVTDPDGLANVVAVGLREAESEGIALRLFDRGSTPQRPSADETAGDGRYTETVRLGGLQPGEVALEAVAVDRAGTVSAPAAFTITVR